MEIRRVVLGTVVPYYITVVNQRQHVRLEVEGQERMRKKPEKMPEEVHTTGHVSNSMVDVVRPGQSIIYNYTEKLEIGHLLNLRASEVDAKGWWINSGSWGVKEHTLISIELQPIVSHPFNSKVVTGLNWGA